MTKDEHLRRHDRAVLAAVEAQSKGRHGLALELYDEALSHARALGNRRKEHVARINLSGCLLSLGEYAAARVGLPAIVLECDAPRLISQAAGQLAYAFMKEGRLERASSYLSTSLDSARRSSDRWQEGWALQLQGHLNVLEGRNEDAVSSYERALEIHAETRESSLVGGLATTLDNLGYALLLAGRLRRGLLTLRRGLRLARESEHVGLAAEIEKDMAFGFLLGDKPRFAERHALRALALARADGCDTVLRSSYYLLMEASLRQDQERGFEDYFARLQDLMPEVRLSRDFFRIFDISDVINLKEF